MPKLTLPILAVAMVGHFMSTQARAELTLPHFFSDHMVVQRDKPVAIWGTADPRAVVRVSFAGQTASSTADEKGAWKVALPPMPANAKGAILEVSSGTESKSLNDVLVGEVWFASGQSNMQLRVREGMNGAQEIAAAKHPGIRMFTAALIPAAEPQTDIDGQWLVCTPENVPSFSAVAYFFARKLHAELGVPIGIISSSWGGKPVETFTSREALASVPEGKRQLAQLDAATASYDPKKAQQRYQAALQRYEKQLKNWQAQPEGQRRAMPRQPLEPRIPASTAGKPAALYNGMIHPFIGYTMRGAIWYQGEANSKTPVAATAYGKLFPLMINDWRKRWNDDFSFLWVQLANFKKPTTQPGAKDNWALLQDQQRKTLSLPKTGMAVINDIGDAGNIHPKNKQDVGLRLALWALATDYGKPVTACGPLYRESEIKDSSIIIHFDYSKGLKTRDGGPLKRFEIAGDDQVWHWADAKISDGTVIVSSPEVPKPAAVRYAWSSNPEGANLVNSDNLPASVFRTDDWPIK